MPNKGLFRLSVSVLNCAESQRRPGKRRNWHLLRISLLSVSTMGFLCQVPVWSAGIDSRLRSDFSGSDTSFVSSQEANQFDWLDQLPIQDGMPRRSKVWQLAQKEVFVDSANAHEGVIVAKPESGLVAPAVQPKEGNPPAVTTPVPGATPTPPTDGKPAVDAVAPSTKPILRAERPKASANPDELKVGPDEGGKVRFNFQGQPWLDVLEWLAKISHLSLDWQELPGDQLNLSTQRAYTVEETRDLLNRHLLDRGYTLLRNRENLIVVNIKKLDPSLVPRVRPQDLAQRQPHEFVKVSFSLDWLLADQAVEELKPMISPNGKLIALKNTNRIEAMDSAANLLEIYEVLKEEQSEDGQERLVKEFPLQHIRANDLDRMLRDLLGLQQPSAGGGAGGNMGADQVMMIQQQLQAIQQAQQQGQQQPGGAAGSERKIHIIVNPRRNSILVEAPANKMAIITQAVEKLDVASGDGSALLKTLNNTRIYRLSAIDPEPFVKILQEFGDLEPTTQIKLDRENNSVIVSGSMADHFVISELVKKLDSSERRFEVIRLRRLEADYVAGTIEFMMGTGGDKKNENNPFFGYMPFGLDMGMGGNKRDAKKFKVSADTENNRLLLWTNDLELKEINGLLAKLGEIPSKESNSDPLRIFEMGTPEEAQKILERLRQVQPGMIAPENANPKVAPAEVKLPVVPSKTQAQPTLPREHRSKIAQGNVPQNTAPRTVDGTGNGHKTPLIEGRHPIVETLLSKFKPQESFITNSVPSKLEPLASEDRAIQPSFAADPSSLITVDDDKSQEAIRKSEVATRQATHGQTLPTQTVRQSRVVSELFQEGPELLVEDNEVSEDGGLPQSESTELERGPNEPVQDFPAPSSVPGGLVQATITPEGQLIIASPDTAALDTLEDMISQILPPRRDFKIFHLKNRNTWAYGVVLNLEKYFGTDKDKGGGGMKYSPFFGYYPSDKKDDGPRNLAKRRVPKFISDSDSRTILVSGADADQLRLIEELINIYDQPEEGDAKALRLTRIFQMKHSKAKVIANAIKEVYRDLLSANDTALQNNQQGDKNQKPSSERSYTYIYGNGSDSGDEGKEPEAPIKFKGLLSLGVDELSNTIVVSAQEGLLENVGQMIDSLDVAAKPTQSTIQVLRVGRGIETSVLQSKLAKILLKPQVQQAPQAPQNSQQSGQPMNVGNGQTINSDVVNE